MILALLTIVDHTAGGWRSFVTCPREGETIHIEDDEGASVLVVEQVIHRPSARTHEAPGLEIVCRYEGRATI